MENKNFEIWVVDTPAALTILDKMKEPALNDFLENKIIVVPLTVCNDVFGEMMFDLDERYHHSCISYKADKIAMLCDALRSATLHVDEEDEGLFFVRGYSLSDLMYFSKVKFAFVLDAINLRDTVDYCNRKIDLVTKGICEYLRVDFGSVEKWPEIKVIERIQKLDNGTFTYERY